jgi:hypothetical protein
MKRFFIAMFMLTFAALPGLAQAGSSAAGKPILPIAQVQTFAARVETDLAARGAHVALVARTGRASSELPKGVDYTHVAFWVYSQMTRDDGSTYLGYRVYNLYQDADKATRSSLVQDTPVDFFAGAHRLDAGIIVPDARLQQKLLKVISGPAYGRLHNPNYAVLANPGTGQFQNCTEFVLDVLMASLYGTADRAQIEANVNAHFTAQVIQVSGIKRSLATLASSGLRTTDHGETIRTATFGTIARFMKANRLTQTAYRLTPTRAQGI